MRLTVSRSSMSVSLTYEGFRVSLRISGNIFEDINLLLALLLVVVVVLVEEGIDLEFLLMELLLELFLSELDKVLWFYSLLAACFKRSWTKGDMLNDRLEIGLPVNNWGVFDISFEVDKRNEFLEGVS